MLILEALYRCTIFIAKKRAKLLGKLLLSWLMMLARLAAIGAFKNDYKTDSEIVDWLFLWRLSCPLGVYLKDQRILNFHGIHIPCNSHRVMNLNQIRSNIEAVRLGDESERDYLGASEIGTECSRALWLKFHRYSQPEQFEPRMLRLFDRGHREEYSFELLLDKAGYQMIRGCQDQEGFKDGFFSGHTDGVWLVDEGLGACVEYKTHSAKSFATLSPGKLKQSHPKHYAQCIVYAGYLGQDGTLYMAVNKDNDELFIDWIEFNEAEFNEYKAKAEYITRTDTPPDRIASKPTDFRCKVCAQKDVCWGFEMPRVDCRNCTSAHKYKTHFECEAGHTFGPPCEDHSFNPYAMNALQGWEPIEFHPQYRAVEYRKKDSTTIINGKAPFGIESKELK